MALRSALEIYRANALGMRALIETYAVLESVIRRAKGRSASMLDEVMNMF